MKWHGQSNDFALWFPIPWNRIAPACDAQQARSVIISFYSCSCSSSIIYKETNRVTRRWHRGSKAWNHQPVMCSLQQWGLSTNWRWIGGGESVAMMMETRRRRSTDTAETHLPNWSFGAVVVRTSTGGSGIEECMRFASFILCSRSMACWPHRFN